MTDVEQVLTYWFGEPAKDAAALLAKVKRWYQGGAAVDQEIAQRFSGLVERALAGELEAWAHAPKSRLALILLLDQFTRNLYRGDPRTYQGDPAAQALALDAFERGMDKPLSFEERQFLIMPLTHAEDLGLQERGLGLIEAVASEAPEPLRPVFALGVEQAMKYREVIARFGRFPHRNALLGRASTEAEETFLRTWAERQAPSALRG
jgi:uncharacterized protein (DUF924 family)